MRKSKKIIKCPFVYSLDHALNEMPHLIQVITGPRQVGKTTGILQICDRIPESKFHYVSADGDLIKPSSFIVEEWCLAQSKGRGVLLVIDEIQKVENWSETVKKLWDEQKIKKLNPVKLVLLGSSSIALQRGLSESLSGRYFQHRAYHWGFADSKNAYNILFDEFLLFGGYPGSYELINNKQNWLNYLKGSIISPVIGKDILQISRVKSPVLFKQCFDLVCSYPAQEISYTKLLGQLQDKGNTDLVKYYLELLEGAYLIKQLFKYSNKKTISKSSSPKILPLCPALYSVTLDADLNTEESGRAFEIIVGAELSQLPGGLFYWREKDFEVDFIYKYAKKLVAIEVKSGRKKSSKGIEKFKGYHPDAEIVIATPQNYLKIIKNLSP
ncbi:MAG: ATP-binding protein [Oligoflexia bacterium]|nr:ATP-binding protein [Oligoflexia bacterium]